VNSDHVAQGADRLLGVTCVTINKSADLKKYECFGQRAIEFMTGQALGWFQLLAVDPEYRKSGIGKALALEQVQWLKQSGCNCLMGTSWQNGSQDNSRHLFEKAGFEKLGESREFLRKQSQETGYLCYVCGGPCQCNSILYGLRF
jgi:GNAT superfamily N-acetyltransferase